MSELPDCLEGGEEARLIPVGAPTQKERFACSVLLASLRVVYPFARTVFAHMNWRVGSWAQIQGYTEPVFRNQPDGLKCRPDGFLILNTGRRERRIIVETKIGSAKIDTDQLAQYCRLAKANNVDAIVTVSNELNAAPAQLPYEPPREARSIPIFHWSWGHLVMLAELLLREEEDFDEEQDYILREIIRYFDHETAGVSWDQQMCAEWPGVVARIQAGPPLADVDAPVLNVVQCWHQQLASLCINRTRKFKFPVTLRLSKSQRDQQTRLTEDLSEFVASNRLSASIEFPAPALPVELIADAKRRNITCRVPIEAPLDRRTHRARVRWLLNQLPEEIALPARVDLIWERGQRSSAPLHSLFEDPNAGRIESPTGPRAFEIVHVVDLAMRFAGRRTFVAALEEALSVFHENIGQHLRPWQPRSSQRVDSDIAAEPAEELDEKKPAPDAGRKVTQSGQFNGKTFSIFDDGSIEVETGDGVQRFRNFAELNAAAAAKNGHAGLD